MKKIKSKKLDFKKVNVVELNANKMNKVVGGSDTGYYTDPQPKSIFSLIGCGNHAPILNQE